MGNNGVTKRIDPLLDNAILQTITHFKNQNINISYREASKLVGEDYLAIWKESKKHPLLRKPIEKFP